jgi:hypothetical protein
MLEPIPLPKPRLQVVRPPGWKPGTALIDALADLIADVARRRVARKAGDNDHAEPPSTADTLPVEEGKS